MSVQTIRALRATPEPRRRRCRRAGSAAVQQAAWSNATCSSAPAEATQDCDPARSPRIKVL